MYTASQQAIEHELNARIPLSVPHWHERINFCAAPADKVNEYFGAHPGSPRLAPFTPRRPATPRAAISTQYCFPG
jgi:hypothetical protein